MIKYKHISLVEREKLYALRLQQLSLRQIGKLLGRSQSSLTREIKRNGRVRLGYIPCHAQAYATKRATAQRTKAPLKNIQIFVYVREHLREPYSWSPEQIAGRLSLDHPKESINTETIYRYIYSKKSRRYKLWQQLPLGRKTRRKWMGRKVKRYEHILGLISIDKRPVEVNTRQVVGHWETDNMEGKKTDKDVISTTVERVSRLTLLEKVKGHSSQDKADALVNRLSGFPESLRQTITQDNGRENAKYTYITQKLKMKVFFCHPYSPWEKGTVENMNGRIRKFLPKGIKLDDISKKQIKEVEKRLNSTPRKCLNYLTPYEKMNQLLTLSDALPL